MVTVELLDRIEQWDRLESEWDRLVADSDEDNPFRRWSWLRAWWTHFGTGRRLAILTAHENRRLAGIAPLCLHVERRPMPVRTLRFLGGTDVCSEYLGLLVRQGCEDRVVPAFLEYLFDRQRWNWDVLRWTDIPAASPQLPLIDRFLHDRAAHHKRRGGVTNCVVRFPETWDAYVAALSSRRRSKLRRICGGFESRDGVEIEIVRDASQFDRCWNELRTLHNRRWADCGQIGCFVDPNFNACHAELAREYLKRRMLLLASLRVDGSALAACYGIRLGETVYEYQRGHDPAFNSMRPGHALQFFLFQHAIAKGVRYWDYLRGDYRHKHDWANASRSTVDLTIPAPRRAQLARFYLERGYRRARRHLGALRRRVAGWLDDLPGTSRT